MNEQLSKNVNKENKTFNNVSSTKMIYKDINDVVKDILNDNIIRLVAAGIIFVSIVLAIFIR